MDGYGYTSESDDDFPIAGASMNHHEKRKKSLSAGERRKKSMSSGEGRKRSMAAGDSRKASMAKGDTRKASMAPPGQRKPSMPPEEHRKSPMPESRKSSMAPEDCRKGSLPSPSVSNEKRLSMPKEPTHTELMWDITAKMAKVGSTNKKSRRGLRIVIAIDKYDWTTEAFECEYFLHAFFLLSQVHKVFFNFSALSEIIAHSIIYQCLR